MDIDLDAILYTYNRLQKTNEPITPEDIAYISGRLEEFLRIHGYIKADGEEQPPPKKKRWFDLRP